jgi:hypothetical protein
LTVIIWRVPFHEARPSLLARFAVLLQVSSDGVDQHPVQERLDIDLVAAAFVKVDIIDEGDHLFKLRATDQAVRKLQVIATRVPHSHREVSQIVDGQP